MTSTKIRWRNVTAAVVGALALAVLPALPASAATLSDTNGSGATLTIDSASITDVGGVATISGTSPVTVDVEGDGFDGSYSVLWAPYDVGIYVTYGPMPSGYKLDRDLYSDDHTLWISDEGDPADGALPFNVTPNEAFDYTLELVPSFVNAGGDTVDCTVTQCYVHTFTAHGANLFGSQNDTSIPVDWN